MLLIVRITVKKILIFSLILIGADFNSITWTEPDYITEDTKDLNFLPGDYELDTFTMSRNNEDISKNYFGYMSKDLNGRTSKTILLISVFEVAAQQIWF